MMTAVPIVNVAQTAGLYSQIAGVLAGFAFTGILIYLNPTDNRSRSGIARTRLEEATRGTVVVLISTLGALVLVAILYAVLAGGPEAAPAASNGILINGLTFSLSILSMFYALGLAAVPHPHLTAMLGVLRVMAGIIGPFIAMLLVASAGLDICTLYPDACNADPYYTPTSPFGYGAVLACIMLVTTLVTFIIQGPKISAAPGRSPVAVATLVLGAAVFGMTATIVLGSQPADYVFGHAALYIFETVSFGLLQAFAILVVVSCRPLRIDDEPIAVPAQAERVAELA